MSLPTQTIVSPYGAYSSVKTTQNAVPPERLRFFLTGAVNTGKSNLLASIGPRCLVIDLEDKHRLIDFPGRSSYYVPTSLEDMDKLILKLLEDGPKKDRPYDMVCIDTMDEFIPFIIDGMTTMMKKAGLTIPQYGDATDYGSGGGKGSKGWKLVNDRIANYQRRLTNAGYGWGISSHLKEETVEVTDKGQKTTKTRLVPMLNPGVLRPVQGLALIKFQMFKRLINEVQYKNVGTEAAPKMIKSGEKMVPQFMLTFDDTEQGAVGLGGNIPVSGTHVVPENRGWAEVVVPQYQAGLARRTASVPKGT